MSLSLNSTVFNLSEGARLNLTPASFSIGGVGSLADTLVLFTVSGLSAGDFFVGGEKQDFFTLADLKVVGKVSFLHNGSEAIPSFNLQLSGNGDSSPVIRPLIVFTHVNEAPSVSSGAMSLNEGGLLLVTRDMINGSDKETSDPAALRVEVKTVSGGYFILSGLKVTSFSLADIDEERVAYRHQGVDLFPSFSFTVVDPTGGRSSLETRSIHINQLNDAPVVVAKAIAMIRGQDSVLTTALLKVTDEETTDPSRLVIRQTFLVNASLLVKDGAGILQAASSFTAKDLADGKVVLRHDGGASAPRFAFKVEDEDGGFSSTINASFRFRDTQGITGNKAPKISLAKINVKDGQTLTVTGEMIKVSDTFSDAGGILLTVSGLKGGQFYLNGVKATLFTMADIEAGNVRFTHTANQPLPSFKIVASDAQGLKSQPFSVSTHVTEVNDPAQLWIRPVAIQEGGAVKFSDSQLLVIDGDNLPKPATLKFFVESIHNGEVRLGNVAVQSFTLADVKAGKVSFVHDGSEDAPELQLSLKDLNGNGKVMSSSLVISMPFQFSTINDLPILRGSDLVVSGNSPNSTITLSTDHFDASDAETANPKGLIFKVTSVSNGEFLRYGQATKLFSLADIQEGIVQFRHTGSSGSIAKYSLVVQDVDGGTSLTFSGQTVNDPSVNDDPPVLILNPIPLVEGGKVLITTAMINATDPDVGTPDAAFRFQVSRLSGGSIVKNGFEVDSFTLADIQAGKISFVHDGSNNVPSFQIMVSDGFHSSAAASASFAFTPVNEAPSDLHLILGAPYFEGDSGSNLGSLVVTDSEDSSGFTFSVNDARFEIVPGAGILRLKADQAPLDFETESSVSLFITASDSGGQSISRSFVLPVANRNEAPDAIALSNTYVLPGDSGAVVGRVYIHDPDGSSGLNLAISDNRFEVVNNLLKLKSGISLAEGDAAVPLTLTVTDGGLSFSDSFLITVRPSTIATITGNGSASGSEDTPVISGSLTVTDPDDGESSFRVLNASGSHGLFAMSANGNWTYAPAASNQALTAGQSVSDSFTVLSFDGSASKAITIVVNGANDTAVIGGTFSATISEDQASGGASGTLTITDADAGQANFQLLNSVSGSYGSFSIDSVGKWAYQLGAAAQNLAVGASATEHFTVRSNDNSASQQISIVINGSNDAPIQDQVIVSERNAPLGQLFSFTLPAGTFVDPEGDVITLSVSNRPAWLNFDPSTGTLSGMPNAGDIGTANPKIIATDSHGDSTSFSLVLSIFNPNNIPVLGGVNSGSLSEDAVSVSGSLTIVDADASESFYKAATVTKGHGSFSITADGSWTYTPGADAQSLALGQILVETFVATSFDGSESQAVTITVTGANDDASFSGTFSASGSEDVTLSGSVSVSDADAGQSSVQAASLSGTYGSFLINSAGAWSFVPGSASQALLPAQSASESFTVFSADNSASQAITVTVLGANDAPSIGGTLSVSGSEDAGTLSGSLTISDADAGQSSFQSLSSNGTYGNLSLATDGSWTYSIQVAAQALAAGQTANDSFTITSADGTASRTLKITLNGANDVAVLGGTINGSLTEDQASVTGTLTINDPDAGQSTFQTLSASGSYGSLSLGSNGAWTYLTGAAAQALDANESVTDTFLARSSDGSASQTISISITGVNDAPVVALPLADQTAKQNEVFSLAIAGTFSDPDGTSLTYSVSVLPAWLSFANGVFSGTPGVNDLNSSVITVTATDDRSTSVLTSFTLSAVATNHDAVISGSGSASVNEDAAILSGSLSVVDIDPGQAFFTATTLSGSAGSFSITSAGAWTYTPSAAAQGLAAGSTVIDNFTVFSVDGSASKTLAITVNGANDVPVISGTSSGSISEDGAVLSGSLSIVDADASQSSFTAASSSGTNGNFSVNTNGLWQFTPKAAAQALGNGENAVENFTVFSLDGSASKSVAVTITGANDAPVISGGTSASGLVSGPINGTLLASDPDANDILSFAVTALGSKGTASINSNGAYIYTPSGTAGLDSFTVSVSDGHGGLLSQVISITNIAVNQVPTIGGNISGSGSEDLSSITGTLSIVDPDDGQSSFQTATLSGSLGSFVLSSNGAWIFTPGSGAQALLAGASASNSFLVRSFDNSASQSVVITVSGANDVPTIGGVSGASTAANGGSVSGQLTISDADAGQSSFQAKTASGVYGNFSSNTSGAWSFTLGPAATGVLAGSSVTESFVVNSVDGTGQKTVTIVITGPFQADIDFNIDSNSNALPDTLEAGNGFRISGDNASDGLGHQVAFVGDINGDGFDDILVGAYQLDPAGGSNAGGAYLIFGKGSAFNAELNLNTDSGLLPGSIASNGIPDLIENGAGILISGDNANDQLGNAVNAAGDFNGDGFADFLVGARYAYNNGISYVGATYLIFGKASGLPSQINLNTDATANGIPDYIEAGGGIRFGGIDYYDQSGWSVNSAGDVNADGFDDLLIGAIRADNVDGDGAGEVYLIYGRASGTPANFDLGFDLGITPGSIGGNAIPDLLEGGFGSRIIGPDAQEQLGYSVSAAGDINGDGYSDFLIGADLADNATGTDVGQVYLIWGQASGLPANIDLNVDTGALLASTAGNGIPDFLENGGGIRLSGEDVSDQFGASVGAAGDVNGDGFADFVIGARYAEVTGLSDVGAAYVIYGRASGLPVDMNFSVDLNTNDTPDLLESGFGFRLVGDDSSDYLGHYTAVTSAGDVNGDGIDDLIIAAPAADAPSRGDAGEVYILFGKVGGLPVDIRLSVDANSNDLPDYLETGKGLRLRGDDTSDWFGHSVSAAGDINGDGFADLLIGALYGDPSGGTDAGEAIVLYGRDFSQGSANITLGSSQTGSAVADHFLGSSGNDVFTQLGSGDSASSGAGDDSIAISAADFLRIDGGNGRDTLILSGGINLDLRSNSMRLQDIEIIDLSGSGNDSLTLDRAAVLGLPGSINHSSLASALRVKGTAGDSLTLSGDFVAKGLSTLDGLSYRQYESSSRPDADVLVQQGVTVTLDANDLAVISGTKIGTINEDVSSVGGSLSISDADVGQSSFLADNIAATYGSFSIASNGAWVFTPNAFAQTLVAGGSVVETFIVRSFDHSASETVSVTVTGSNDPTLISGTNSNSITLDGRVSLAGKLSATDLDASPDQATFQAQTFAGTYGSFSVNKDGGWSYAPDYFDDDTRLLLSGTASESFLVRSFDGSASITMSFVLNGATRLPLSDLDLAANANSSNLPDLIEAGYGFRLNGDNTSDNFGHNVALIGDVNGDGFDDMLIGATLYDSPGRSDAGGAWLVFGKAGGFAQDIDFNTGLPAGSVRFTGEQASAQLGNSVNPAGDFNGDGIADFLIGARYNGGNSGYRSGATYLIFGTRSAFAAQIDFSSDANGNGLPDFIEQGGGIRFAGNDTYDYSGFSVNSAGDVNGDGYADLLIGAIGADNVDGDSAGESYLIYGRASGLPSNFDLNLDSGAYLGSIAGNDLPDLLENGFGSRILGPDAQEQTGYAVSAAGDVNGDGFGDFLISADLADNATGTDTGMVYLIWGKNGQLPDNIDLNVDSGALTGSTAGNGVPDFLENGGGILFSGEDSGDHLGSSVSAAGDLNGDGFDDFLLGAAYADNLAMYDAGAVYVIYGRASGLPVNFDLSVDVGNNDVPDSLEAGFGFRISGAYYYDALGYYSSVTAAGDVNGDGFEDILISAYIAESPGRSDSGEAYLLFGKAGGFTTDLKLNVDANSNDIPDALEGGKGLRIRGPANSDWFGHSVSGGGDINGDGFDDLIIGAVVGDPTGGTDAGQAYVIYGRDFTQGGDSIKLGSSLAGSASVDHLIGSSGNDSFTNLGSGDSASSGAGDDSLTLVSNTFLRLDGGTGRDTLALGAGISLDLNSNLTRIKGFEIIDLGSGGSSSESLLLDRAAILALPDSRDQNDLGSALRVLGGSSDNLTLAGDFVDRGLVVFNSTSFRHFESSSSPGADVLVQQGLTVTNDSNDLPIIGGVSSGTLGEDDANLSRALTISDADVGEASFLPDSIAAVYGTFAIAANGAWTFTPNAFAQSLNAGQTVSESFLVTSFDRSGSQTVTVTVTGSNDPTVISGTSSYNLSLDGRIGLAGNLTASDADADATQAAFTARTIVGTYGSFGIDAAGAWIYRPDYLDADTKALGNGVSATDSFTVLAKDGASSKTMSFIISGAAKLALADLDLGANANGNGLPDLVEAGYGFRLDGDNTSDNFGHNVAIIGDVNGDGFDDILIGAPLHDRPGFGDAGAAYLVFGQASGFAMDYDYNQGLPAGSVKISGDLASDQLGNSVNPAGDFNGDGLADFLIGARYNGGNGGYRSGSTYLIFGRRDGFSNIALSVDSNGNGLPDYIEQGGGIRFSGNDTYDYSGYNVNSAGDVNGDGYSDILIGSIGADNIDGDSAGEVSLVYGRASGTPANFDLNLDSGIVLGATAGNDVPDLLEAGFGTRILGPDAQEQLGYAVAAAGDVNGDGFGDFLISANLADNATGSNTGMVYLVWGQNGKFPANLDLGVDNGALSGSTASNGVPDFIEAGGGILFSGEDANDNLGSSVSAAGDLNGDGYADFIIAATYADSSAVYHNGSVYVIYGRSSGLPVNFDLNVDSAAIVGSVASNDIPDYLEAGFGFRLSGTSNYDYLGYYSALSAAGDVNGDGYADILIAAPYAESPGRSDSGEAYLLFGKAGGFTGDLKLSVDGNSNDIPDLLEGGKGLRIRGPANSDWFGHSVSAGGDINGDGFDDLIVGAVYGDTPGGTDAGQAYVIYGRDFTQGAGTINVGSSFAGGASPDHVVGSSGSDSFTNIGSGDSASSGAGDDSIQIVSNAFLRLDGGTGRDSLALASGISLDLSSNLTRIQGFEIIDLAASTLSESLILNSAAILALPDSRDQSGLSSALRIKGGSGDSVTLVGDFVDKGAFTFDGVGYRAYEDSSRPSADVLIQNGLTLVIDANDPAVISGTSSGTVSENGPALNGSLTVVDPDPGQSSFLPDSVSGFYGNFTIAAGGAWSYTPNALAQSLAAGSSISEDFLVSSFDRSASQTVTVTVTGANDAPSIGGALSASLSKDGTLFATGDLSISDPDVGQSFFQARSSIAGNLGRFSIDAGGSWTYALDYLDADTQALTNGNSRSESFVVTSADGAASVTLSITINGAATIKPTTHIDLNANTNISSVPDYLETGYGLLISGDDSSDYLGYSVSGLGDVNGDGFADFIVGAYRADAGSRYDAGEAYVFFGKASGLPSDFNLNLDVGANGIPDLLEAGGGFRISGDASYDYLGYSVSSAGDVNGDGLADILVGAYLADTTAGGYDAGETYLIFGSKTLLANYDLSADAGLIPGATAGNFVPDVLEGGRGLRINGVANYDHSGWSVRSAGDFNGDGFDDLIISADYGDTLVATDVGESYLIFGKASVLPSNLDLATDSGILGGSIANNDIPDYLEAGGGIRISGDDVSDRSGYSVSSAGDINGDGFADLLIGALYPDTTGGTDAGEIYLVFGKASGLPVNFDLNDDTGSLSGSIASNAIPDALEGGRGIRFSGDDAYDYLGYALAAGGDFNGDGFDDFLLSAYAADPAGGGDAGEVYLIFGKASGWTQEINLNNDNGSLLGSTSANGIPDFLDAGGGFRISGDDNSDYTGVSVSSAGDVNGDGLDDLIFGAHGGDTNGGTDAGVSYVLFGKASGTPVSVDLNTDTGVLSGSTAGNGIPDYLEAGNGFRISGDDAYDYTGISVSSAGDVNGDGFADLLVGAYLGDPNGGGDAGEAVLIFGRDFSNSGAVKIGSNLSGTVSVEHFVGTSGADTFLNLGSGDSVTSGAGDDLVSIGASGFLSLDAGFGKDTLSLASGINLDLSALGNSRITGFEVIDLNASGANVLTLGTADILALSDELSRSDLSAALRIKGSAADSVDLVGSFTFHAQHVFDAITYNHYHSSSNEDIDILIQSGISVV